MMNQHKQAAEESAALVLQIRKLIFSTSLNMISRCNVVDTEVMWDRYNETFRKVVDISEVILERHYSPGIKGAWISRPHFTLDMSIIAPLYDISRRCRYPITRRRAISLLYRYPRREGIYDSVLAA